MRQSFLSIAYRRSKTIFICCCLFIAGAMVPVLLRIEVTPFYDWSMYAWPQQIAKTYTVPVLKYNGGTVYNPAHTWADHRQMMMTYTMGNYIKLTNLNDTLPLKSKTATLFYKLFGWDKNAKLYNDSKAIAEYPVWLKKYLSQQIGQPVNDFELSLYNVTYSNTNRVIPISKTALITEE